MPHEQSRPASHVALRIEDAIQPRVTCREPRVRRCAKPCRKSAGVATLHGARYIGWLTQSGLSSHNSTTVIDDATGSEIAPELVFGLVTPIGVDGQAVADLLTDVLASEVDYHSQLIHVIDWLVTTGRIPPAESPGIDGMSSRIDAGNTARQRLDRKDAFALFAIRAIFENRASGVNANLDDPDNWQTIPSQSRMAYIVRSIRRPEEIQLLRRVYGPWLIIISVFATRKVRFQHILDGLVEKGLSTPGNRAVEKQINDLLDRDARESENATYGQDTRRAFSQADIFIDVSNDTEEQLRRFIRLIFGDRSRTPTPDEYAMFMARAAALRSSSPGRQVGAVITDPMGEVITAGTNEVPRPHGGYEWDDPEHDHRDIAQVEGNTFGEMLRKRELILDTLHRLAAVSPQASLPKVITDEAKQLIEANDVNFVEELRAQVLKDSDIDSVIEYQRTVHAEMAALQNAHRHGTPVDGCTIYTTSFPCHICAKHILSAGLRRVVYIEPYPKSRAKGFYPEAIRVDGENAGADPVVIDPFIGVGPSLYQQLFTSIGERMSSTGSIRQWKRGQTNLPRLGPGNSRKVNAESIRAVEMVGLVDLIEVEKARGK